MHDPRDKRGRVTFVYSKLEFRGDVIAVLFDGRDEAIAIPADNVRKVAQRQSSWVPVVKVSAPAMEAAPSNIIIAEMQAITARDSLVITTPLDEPPQPPFHGSLLHIDNKRRTYPRVRQS
jgi:hypothetical protein